MFDLPEKITIWNRVSNDGFGGFSWSAPIVASARVAFKTEKFTDPEGDDRLSKAVFYTRSGSLVIGSKILIGESAANTPPAEADDAIQVTNTPSGAGDLKKGWL